MHSGRRMGERCFRRWDLNEHQQVGEGMRFHCCFSSVSPGIAFIQDSPPHKALHHRRSLPASTLPSRIDSFLSKLGPFSKNTNQAVLLHPFTSFPSLTFGSHELLAVLPKAPPSLPLLDLWLHLLPFHWLCKDSARSLPFSLASISTSALGFHAGSRPRISCLLSVWLEESYHSDFSLTDISSQSLHSLHVFWKIYKNYILCTSSVFLSPTRL